MTEIQESVVIEQTQINDKDCIKFTFQGLFTKEDALMASKEWKEIASSGKKFIVIFHAKEMAGYEPMARAIWQKMIVELKSQIENIWLITDSKLIAAGAAIMSMFTSFTIKTVNSEEKIVV